MKIIGTMECITFVNKSWSPMIEVTKNDQITIMAIEAQPFLLVKGEKYSMDNKTVYNSLCGPLITLMCQFAWKIGTSLKLLPKPKSLQDLIRIINEGSPQFFLRQADTNVLNFYNLNKAYFKKIKHFSGSNVIDYQALSYIAYKAYPGKKELFIYFKFFDYTQYLIILLTLMLISNTLMIIHNRIGFERFLSNIGTLSTVLITSVYHRSIVKGKITMKNMFVLGPWFLTAFFIAIMFNNLILDSMETVIPNQVIDSWEDLETKKNVKIIAENVEFLVQFSKKSNSKMASNFRNRFQEFNLEHVHNMTIMNDIANDLISGRAAYVKNKVTIAYNILYLQAIFKLGNRLLDSLHLSENGGPDEQYFIIIPSTTPKNLADKFNS